MTNPRLLKKPLLYSLIVSVILGALLGIALVLRGTWGWYEVRVIMTTITIAGASLCGLACELSKTPLGTNRLPRSGLVLTALAAALLLFGLWAEPNSETFWKVVTSAATFAVATVHVCLLSIAKLIRRFQWVYLVGCQTVFGLATLLVVIMWGEIDSPTIWRFVAALSIVVAAFTIVIPILHRIGKMDARKSDMLMPIDERNVASIDAEIADLRSRITHLERLRIKIAGDDAIPASSND